MDSGKKTDFLDLVSFSSNNSCYNWIDSLVAPFVGADADDTAFGLTTLNLIGKSVLADRLVQEFEALDHFKTYSMERNPSLSANCNVLNALLHTPEPEKYMKQIEKCISFLCNQWWISDGKIEDKWVRLIPVISLNIY
jgi:hypothetical protein